MLRIYVWDTVIGNIVLINTGNGKNVVIDFGIGSTVRKDPGFSPLRFLRERWGISVVDGFILTHYHAGHFADIQNFHHAEWALFPDKAPYQDILLANPYAPEGLIERLVTERSRFRPAGSYDESPFSAESNGGVVFEMYRPDSTLGMNNSSLVTFVSYGGHKVLLPGDNGPEAWSDLLVDEEFLSVLAGTTVLVAPRHGNPAGFAPELLKQMPKCRLAVFSGPWRGRRKMVDAYSRYMSGMEVMRASGPSQFRKVVRPDRMV